MLREILGFVCIGCGLLFFLAGSIGLLRFPDVYTRLHALTKADNVGLGFIVAGLMLSAESWRVVARLALVEALVLIASATVCHLIARAAHREKIAPWERRP
ncbi:monovalent cation/H(+) antiporter subunit G [Thiovibrio sp. JS02]